jgi:integrase
MTNQKTFNFTPNSIHALPFSDRPVMYFDINKSFMVANSKLALAVGKRTKTFKLIYRKSVNGKPTKIEKQLGAYPEMSLGQARDKFADEVRIILASTDAFIKKSTEAPITFNECADFYIEDRAPSKNEIGIINNAKKELGNMPMKDITKSVVRNYYQPQRLEGKYNSANYKREIVQRIWNYNLEENEDACTSFENLRNPAHHKIRLYKAKGFWKPRPSEAKVKDEQIKPMFEAIDNLQNTDKKNLIKLFFYLGQHPFTEICEMRWDQISKVDNQYWWNMEEGFHKTEFAHSVPLHPTVMKIINAQKGKDAKYVFVSSTRKDNKGNLLPYLRSGFQKQIKAIKEHLEDQSITFQCFRATVTTKLRELGKGHEPSYLMNQQLQGISNRVYTRSDFTDFKVAMVNDWMEFIEDKLNEK